MFILVNIYKYFVKICLLSVVLSGDREIYEFD